MHCAHVHPAFMLLACILVHCADLCPHADLLHAACAVGLTVCLQNLPTDADKLFLYEKFSPYGAILSVKVLNDPQSGQCRGVGFVVSLPALKCAGVL